MIVSQIFSSCYALSIASPFYFIDEDNKRITYEYHGSYVVDGADVDTFTWIKEPDSYLYNKISGIYAKDKNHVYLMGKIIPNADPKTFTALTVNYDESPPNFGKDKQHVYLGLEIVPDLDAETFEMLGLFFSKDKNGLYYKTIALKYEGDLKSTQIRNIHFLFDDTYVYFNGHRINGSDGKSFSYLPPSIYLSEKKLSDREWLEGEAIDIDKLPHYSEYAEIWDDNNDYSYSELYEEFGNWRKIKVFGENE